MVNENFAYFNNTELEEYYRDIIKAQVAAEEYPDITKIILRKVVEDIIRKTAEKYDIDSEESIRDIITSLKYNFNICFPEQICKYINTIRFNGINKEDSDVGDKRIFSAENLLKMANKVFIWYLKDVEKTENFNEAKATIVLPDNLDKSIYEREKVLNDIVDKEYQINNLREKVIELADKSQNIVGFNRIVMAIKDEKKDLLKQEKVLNQHIKLYKESIKEIEANYDRELANIDKLKEEYAKYDKLISEKEDKLVKTEISNQDFKRVLNSYEGEYEDIAKYELIVNESLDKLRKAYKNLISFCKEYKDIIASIQFAYREEYKNTLQNKQAIVKNNIINEDKLFEEEMIVYFNNINDAKKNTKILTKLVNDQITRKIRYYEFYKGFLNLKGECLRDIYLLTSKYTIQLIVNSGKGAFGKLDIEKAQEVIKSRRQEINNIADEELKVQLYYRFANTCELNDDIDLNSRKNFIATLDNIVDKAYEFLQSDNVVKNNDNKLSAIKMYYIYSVIEKLKKIYIKNQINVSDEFVQSIINAIQRLDESEKEYVYKSLNALYSDDLTFINIIKSDVFKIIDIFFNINSKFAYTCACSIIYALYYYRDNIILEDVLNNESKLKTFVEKTIVKEIFLAQDGFSIEKFDENQKVLLPLFVFQIVAADEILEQYTDLASYTSICDYWALKQQQYNDLIIYEKKHKMDLTKLLNEKEKLKMDNYKTSKNYIILSSKYNNSINMFRKEVLSSEKIQYLPSYLNYASLIEKKEQSVKSVNTAIEKLGDIRIAMETGIWKDSQEKYMNDPSIKNVENLLVEEAKKSKYFKEEYDVVLNLQKEIENINEHTMELKESIKKNEDIIRTTKNELENCNKQVKLIKDMYPDIEAAYWG